MTISMKLFISFFVFTTFFFNLLSFCASAAQISYSDHCASVVPESIVKINSGSQYIHLIHTGYYYIGGGSDILNLYSPEMQVKNSVGFQCLDIRETHVQGLFKLEGTLDFQVTNRFQADSMPPIVTSGSVSFRLNGFWSEPSGNLCMVGSSTSMYSKLGHYCILAKNCTPISTSESPRAVLFKDISCSEDNGRVRVLVEFTDGRLNQYQCPTLFNPNTTLVGEGSWDAKKNQLYVVACRFLNTTHSLNSTNVGDCSTRLSLRIHAEGTMGRTSNIVGQIWSTKTVTELGYFEKITFASRERWLPVKQLHGFGSGSNPWQMDWWMSERILGFVTTLFGIICCIWVRPVVR
uniref:uncharacterized protein LOC105349945 n=1 Tax=Fragaria vesca subsp. vesca TaxID=101020 RepID=UPI0005C81672|nr:PREDICTED: uncharacterized protein LOC105349945 [Fragaria vesca subsp. vesca]